MISRILRAITVWRYKRKVKRRLERAKTMARLEHLFDDTNFLMPQTYYSSTSYTVNGKTVSKEEFDKASKGLFAKIGYDAKEGHIADIDTDDWDEYIEEKE